MSFDRLLSSQAIVLRLTGSIDTYGNVERAYATLPDTIKVRLDINASSENTDDREATTQTGVVYTRANDIEPFDLLVIDNATWEITGVPIPRFSPVSLHHYEIPVRRRTA